MARWDRQTASWRRDLARAIVRASAELTRLCSLDKAALDRAASEYETTGAAQPVRIAKVGEYGDPYCLAACHA